MTPEGLRKWSLGILPFFAAGIAGHDAVKYGLNWYNAAVLLAVAGINISGILARIGERNTNKRT
jgi:hypothetical protein